jgi:hypothetical protein
MWAVPQVLAGTNEPLHVEEIERRLRQQYPEIAKRSKNLLGTVETVCSRRCQEGRMEQVNHRRYSLVKREGEKE